MVTVKDIETRRRSDGFVESEARVEVKDTSRVTAGDLDLSHISYVTVGIAQSGGGVATSDPMVVTQASLHNPGTAANSLTVGIASFSGGTFGSLVEASGSAIVSITARGE